MKDEVAIEYLRRIGWEPTEENVAKVKEAAKISSDAVRDAIDKLNRVHFGPQIKFCTDCEFFSQGYRYLRDYCNHSNSWYMTDAPISPAKSPRSPGTMRVRDDLCGSEGRFFKPKRKRRWWWQ